MVIGAWPGYCQTNTNATPSSGISLRSLTANAESIVVAEIERGEGTSPVLRVQRAIKGPRRAGTHVQLPEGSPPGCRGLALVFLPPKGMPAAATCYVIARDQPVHPFAASGKAPVLDRVVAELVNAADSNAPDVVEIYRTNRSAALRQMFDALRTSTNTRHVTLWLRAGIVDGDVEAIGSLTDAVRKLDQAGEGAVVDELRTHFRSSDPTAVRALGKVATAQRSYNTLRIAAATALARVHTEAAVPYLAALLENDDPEIHWLGVRGLFDFVSESKQFRTVETSKHWPTGEDPATLGFWRRWWSKNQQAFSQAEKP